MPCDTRSPDQKDTDCLHAEYFSNNKTTNKVTDDVMSHINNDSMVTSKDKLIVALNRLVDSNILTFNCIS